MQVLAVEYLQVEIEGADMRCKAKEEEIAAQKAHILHLESCLQQQQV